MWRGPERTTLTPCRIGASAQPALRAHRSVAGREHQPVPSGIGWRWPRDWARGALLDDDELTTRVVDAGLVETHDDLQGEDQLAVEVAVQRVPVPRAVPQHQRCGPRLPGGVALLEPGVEVVGPRCGLAAVAPPSRGRSAAGAARTPLEARPRCREADPRSSGTGPRRSGGGPCRSSNGTVRRRRRGRSAPGTRPPGAPSSSARRRRRRALRRGLTSRGRGRTARGSRTWSRSRLRLVGRQGIHVGSNASEGCNVRSPCHGPLESLV